MKTLRKVGRAHFDGFDSLIVVIGLTILGLTIGARWLGVDVVGTISGLFG